MDTVSEVFLDGLDHRIRVCRCGTTVDSFAIITERYLIAVDTLVSLESMAAVMEALVSDSCLAHRSLLVVNTHADWDHVWGNGLFVGSPAPFPAPIVGHRLTAEAMAAPEAAAFLASFKAENPGRYDSAAWWPPTVRFEGELRIDGGDLTLHLLPTPGHTPDHVSLWIPDIRLLLAGDAAEMPFPSVSRWEMLPELRLSLRRLDELNADTALYSHAPSGPAGAVTDPALIRYNLAYFDELERRCRALVAASEGTERLDAGDPAALLGWPLGEALPPGATLETLTSVDFYANVHADNVRAMVRWLKSKDFRQV